MYESDSAESVVKTAAEKYNKDSMLDDMIEWKFRLEMPSRNRSRNQRVEMVGH